ncbi:MAG: hypothetical protein MJ252_04725 [archaeon]|nr:hypothetical protein [archaeon]
MKQNSGFGFNKKTTNPMNKFLNLAQNKAPSSTMIFGNAQSKPGSKGSESSFFQDDSGLPFPFKNVPVSTPGSKRNFSLGMDKTTDSKKSVESLDNMGNFFDDFDADGGLNQNQMSSQATAVFGQGVSQEGDGGLIHFQDNLINSNTDLNRQNENQFEEEQFDSQKSVFMTDEKKKNPPPNLIQNPLTEKKTEQRHPFNQPQNKFQQNSTLSIFNPFGIKKNESNEINNTKDDSTMQIQFKDIPSDYNPSTTSSKSVINMDFESKGIKRDNLNPMDFVENPLNKDVQNPLNENNEGGLISDNSSLPNSASKQHIDPNQNQNKESSEINRTMDISNLNENYLEKNLTAFNPDFSSNFPERSDSEKIKAVDYDESMGRLVLLSEDGIENLNNSENKLVVQKLLVKDEYVDIELEAKIEVRKRSKKYFFNF